VGRHLASAVNDVAHYVDLHPVVVALGLRPYHRVIEQAEARGIELAVQRHWMADVDEDHVISWRHSDVVRRWRHCIHQQNAVTVTTDSHWMRHFTTFQLYVNVKSTASRHYKYWPIDLPSCDLKRRQDKFILRYVSTVNGFCQFCKKLYYIIGFGEQRWLAYIWYFVYTPVPSVNYCDGLGRCFRLVCIYACAAVFFMIPYFRWTKIYIIEL